MLNGRSKCAVIAAIWCLAYGIYLITYFGGAISSSDGAEVLGSLIGGAIVMPHMITELLAAVFFFVGLGIKKKILIKNSWNSNGNMKKHMQKRKKSKIRWLLSCMPICTGITKFLMFRHVSSSRA